jgi:hypothetical protein
MTWTECSESNVFPGGDASFPPGVIVKHKQTTILHGLSNFVLIAEG